MPTIKIDNKDYDLDTLPQNVKDQLAALQFVDAELNRLQAQTAAMQTARAAYGRALNETLAKLAVPLGGDTIKLG